MNFERSLTSFIKFSRSVIDGRMSLFMALLKQSLFPGYRARTTRQLFRAKKLPENAFYRSDAAKAKRSLVEASSNLYDAERRDKWSYLAKRKNFALQLRFIATPFSQKSADFCEVW